MGLHKGMTNNKAGRTPGSQNKITSELRQRISKFLEDQWDTLQTEFEGLESKDKLAFFERLLNYAIPKLQATTLTTDLDNLTDEQLDYIIESLLNSQKHE